MGKKSAFLAFSAMTALAVAMTAAPKPAEACGDGAYIGQICIMATQYCPINTVEVNGQVVSTNESQALFSLIGCTFGGDCRTTMGYPDLRGRVPTHAGRGVGLTERTFAVPYGQEGIQQTMTMLAPHTHTASVSGGGNVSILVSAAAGNKAVPDPNSTVYLSGLTGKSGATSATMKGPYTTTEPTTTANLGGVVVTGGGGGSVTVDPTGSGRPIPTIPPSIALRYCMVVNGLYPSRP